MPLSNEFNTTRSFTIAEPGRVAATEKMENLAIGNMGVINKVPKVNKEDVHCSPPDITETHSH